MTYYYPAVITKKDKDEGYRVDFLDLDQCFGEARDLEDALEDARYNGVNWILTELEDRMELPAQTHLDDVELAENQTATMIALLMPRDGWDE